MLTTDQIDLYTGKQTIIINNGDRHEKNDET